MAAHPISLDSNAPQPAPSAKRSWRGLYLVTSTKKQESAETLDSLAQARRIVAQVEWEIQQQAARERAYRNNRWRAPIAATAGRNAHGFLSKLRSFAGF